MVVVKMIDDWFELFVAHSVNITRLASSSPDSWNFLLTRRTATTQEGDVYRATHATRRRMTLTGGMRIKAKRAEGTLWRAGNRTRLRAEENLARQGTTKLCAHDEKAEGHGKGARRADWDYGEKGADTATRTRKWNPSAGRARRATRTARRDFTAQWIRDQSELELRAHRAESEPATGSRPRHRNLDQSAGK